MNIQIATSEKMNWKKNNEEYLWIGPVDSRILCVMLLFNFFNINQS